MFKIFLNRVSMKFLIPLSIIFFRGGICIILNRVNNPELASVTSGLIDFDSYQVFSF
jgi:hypothetical protein